MSDKIWNPETAFQIKNPVRGFQTCVGWAPSQRRRCQNPIAAYNRAAACEILEDLAEQYPSTTRMKGDLYELAGLCLCRRYHQDQANDMVNKWIRIIRTERDHLDSEPARTSSPHSPPITVPAMSTGHNVRPSAAIAAIISDITPVRPTASPVTRTTRATISSPTPTPASRLTATPRTPPISSQHPPAQRLLTQRLPAQRLVAPVCYPRHALRRSSDEDCSICTLPLTNVSLADMVWCKRTCGHNFHKECWETWSATGARTCVYCRSPWHQDCDHDSTAPAFAIWTEDDLGLESLFDVIAHLRRGVEAWL